MEEVEYSGQIEEKETLHAMNRECLAGRFDGRISVGSGYGWSGWGLAVEVSVLKAWTNQPSKSAYPVCPIVYQVEGGESEEKEMRPVMFG